MSDDKAKLLIVDDTPENIDVLVEVLKNEYRIRAAINGEQGLKIARLASAPDLILLDVMMPGIDGFEVCRQLKADPTTCHIPIIFVTAKITTRDEIEGFALGAVDYITKPISPPVVLARVKTHLALYDQNRELDRKVREQTRDIHDTRLKIIQRLGRASEFKDDNTGLHVIRMSHYARVLGLASGMSDTMADMLLDAAPMHDIGKIGIPDRILQKCQPLDEEEWRIMQTHTQMGQDIIGDDDSELLKMANAVAISHHEHWDGGGYPYGVAGDAIPIVGRIVAIADVFDALTSVRPYKDAWPIDDAVNYLQQHAGTQFDARLVSLFIDELAQILAIREQYFEQ